MVLRVRAARWVPLVVAGLSLAGAAASPAVTEAKPPPTAHLYGGLSGPSTGKPVPPGVAGKLAQDVAAARAEQDAALGGPDDPDVQAPGRTATVPEQGQGPVPNATPGSAPRVRGGVPGPVGITDTATRTALGAVAQDGVSAAWQPREMSLMIQVSQVHGQRDFQDAIRRLTDQLEDVRSLHRRPGERGFVRNLVLQDIGGRGTVDAPQGLALYTDVLDAVTPYLPGQSKGAFDHVFVGTLIETTCPQLHHQLECATDPVLRQWSPYVEGMLDADVRVRHIADSTTLANRFKQTYPAVTELHWYLSWEAFLPDLMRDVNYNDAALGFSVRQDKRTTDRIRAAYLAYQLELIKQLSGVYPDRAVLWSPAVNQSWAQIEADRQSAAFDTNINAYFTQLRDGAALYTDYAARGLSWFHFQDTLARACWGQFAGQNTVVTSSEWYSHFQGLFPYADLAVNAELFVDAVCQEAGTPARVRERLREYESRKVPLGAGFDLNNWYRVIHADQPDVHTVHQPT